MEKNGVYVSYLKATVPASGIWDSKTGIVKDGE
jgi:hypothetical protein